MGRTLSLEFSREYNEVPEDIVFRLSRNIFALTLKACKLDEFGLLL